ncbi:MAG: metal-dependent hydrolase [Salinigranum sp.]
MWPWGHLGFGYLLLTSYDHLLGGRRPGDVEALALAFGTQFPDLIDKPLAWSLGVLPGGRTLAHSVFTATVVIAVVIGVTRRRRATRVGVGFGLGYVSHLVGDSVWSVAAGDYGALSFLLWPALPLPGYDTETGILRHFAELEFTPVVAVGLVLGAIAVGAWVRDGMPGLRLLRDAVRRRIAPS